MFAPIAPPIRWLGLLAFAAFAFPLSAETVTLTPVADTSIFQRNPLNNVGGSQSLAAGDTATVNPCRALIRFDVAAALPPDATVTSVRLELAVVRTVVSTPTLFDLHRLGRAWGEGDKGAGDVIGAGEPATEAEATWIARFHPDVEWDEPGGSTGTDFARAASASGELATQETLVFESTPGMNSDVQGWLADPAANFGWLLKARNEFAFISARRFGSREHPQLPPRLVVQFENQKAGPQLRGVEQLTDQFCFRFAAAPGKAYSVQRREQIDSGNWITITNLPPTTATQEVFFCQPLEAGSHFYRVEER